MSRFLSEKEKREAERRPRGCYESALRATLDRLADRVVVEHLNDLRILSSYQSRTRNFHLLQSRRRPRVLIEYSHQKYGHQVYLPIYLSSDNNSVIYHRHQHRHYQHRRRRYIVCLLSRRASNVNDLASQFPRSLSQKICPVYCHDSSVRSWHRPASVAIADDRSDFRPPSETFPATIH